MINLVFNILNLFFYVLKYYYIFSEHSEGMKTPFTTLLKQTHVDIAKSSVTTLCPHIWDILIFYSTRTYLADILLDYTTPSEHRRAGLAYCNTLLGALFCLSILPKSPAGTYEFFTNPLNNVSCIS